MTADKINQVQWVSVSLNKNTSGRTKDKGRTIISRMICRETLVKQNSVLVAVTTCLTVRVRLCVNKMQLCRLDMFITSIHIGKIKQKIYVYARTGLLRP